MQITLPLAIGVFVLLIFSILVVLGENSTVRRWADISMIWLIIPVMFFTFLGMLLLAGMVYMTVYLVIELPFLSYRLLIKLRVLQAAIRKFSDRLVEPFLRVESFKASMQAVPSGLRKTRAEQPTTRPQPEQEN